MLNMFGDYYFATQSNLTSFQKKEKQQRNENQKI